jgi:hypothetical protein
MRFDEEHPPLTPQVDIELCRELADDRHENVLFDVQAEMDEVSRHWDHEDQLKFEFLSEPQV